MQHESNDMGGAKELAVYRLQAAKEDVHTGIFPKEISKRW